MKSLGRHTATATKFLGSFSNGVCVRARLKNQCWLPSQRIKNKLDQCLLVTLSKVIFRPQDPVDVVIKLIIELNTAICIYMFESEQEC